MTIVVRVDASDGAACNVRCLGSNHFCNGYPHCVAGYFHKVKDLLTPGDTDRRVVREDRTRSAQGGYSRSRIIQGADDASSIEEIELHCKTLKFESLVRTVPTPPPASPPDSKAPHA